MPNSKSDYRLSKAMLAAWKMLKFVYLVMLALALSAVAFISMITFMICFEEMHHHVTGGDFSPLIGLLLVVMLLADGHHAGHTTRNAFRALGKVLAAIWNGCRAVLRFVWKR